MRSDGEVLFLHGMDLAGYLHRVCRIEDMEGLFEFPKWGGVSLVVSMTTSEGYLASIPVRDGR